MDETDATSPAVWRLSAAKVMGVVESDRQLKGKCLRAGDPHVVVREADLAAVRKAVRHLGYVWPIPGD